jgi:hypothetical protein
MKKIIIYFVCLFFILGSNFGCSPYLLYTYKKNYLKPKDRHKYANIKIVIDVKGIKDLNNGQRLIKKMISVLRYSFENVSTCTSCLPKRNTIYILPKKFIQKNPKINSNIEVFYNSKSETFYRESEQGELWGVVIGINRYASPKIPPLKYARNDAESFASYLKNTMGMDSKHLIELYDDKATRRNITLYLGDFLKQKASKKEDTVYIFYAGHGAPEIDDKSKNKDGITKYILPFDADLEYLFSTALDMDRIADIFERIRAQRIFL